MLNEIWGLTMFLCVSWGSDEDDPEIQVEKMIVNSERISYVEEKEPNRRGLRSTIWLDDHASNKFWAIDVMETVEYIAAKLQAV
jgi:hypothetical protein